MAQRHFLFLRTLTFVATPAFAMIQGDDLKIAEEGGTVYINGDQGATASGIHRSTSS